MITLVIGLTAVAVLYMLVRHWRRRVARLAKVHEEIDDALAVHEALKQEKKLNVLQRRNTKQEERNNAV